MSEITFIKSRKSNILLSLMKSDKKYTFTIKTRTTQIKSSIFFIEKLVLIGLYKIISVQNQLLIRFGIALRLRNY